MKIIRTLFIILKSFLLFSGCAAITVFASANQRNGAKEQSYPVLMYHHILPEENNTLFKNNSCVLALNDFEEQMKYIYDNGFYTMTCADVLDFLYSSKIPPENSVWITFDDGYDSNFIYAYDILKKYNFRATIFVISSYITERQIPSDPGKLIYLYGKDMIKYSDVFDYASHSDNLHYLNETGQAALEFEEESVIYADTTATLSNPNITAKAVYSYPYGKFREDAVRILKDSGIKAAVTVNIGYMDIFSDPYSIPRFDVYRGIEYNRFKKILNKHKS